MTSLDLHLKPVEVSDPRNRHAYLSAPPVEAVHVQGGHQQNHTETPRLDPLRKRSEELDPIILRIQLLEYKHSTSTMSTGKAILDQLEGPIPFPCLER